MLRRFLSVPRRFDPFRAILSNPDPFNVLANINSILPNQMVNADLHEDQDAYKIIVDVPGMKKDDLDVNVDPDSQTLTLHGRQEATKEETGGDNKNVIYRERITGQFKRIFHFDQPIKADSDQISAELKEGVLTLTVPKDTSGGKISGKKIEIKG